MKRVCQNLLVPALDAGLQKDRPYQSDFIGPVLMQSRVKRGNRIVSTHLLYEFYKNLTLVNFLDLEGMLEEMVREVTSHHMEHILFARIEHKVFLCLLNPSNIVF